MAVSTRSDYNVSMVYALVRPSTTTTTTTCVGCVVDYRPSVTSPPETPPEFRRHPFHLKSALFTSTLCNSFPSVWADEPPGRPRRSFRLWLSVATAKPARHRKQACPFSPEEEPSPCTAQMWHAGAAEKLIESQATQLAWPPPPSRNGLG